MANDDKPQIYLITPPSPDLSVFPNMLQDILNHTEIACVRLATAGMEETAIRRTADHLREITHGQDIPLVIEDHVLLMGQLGLDGVHLTHDGHRQVRALRSELGADVILGVSCGTSRHDAMNAAEAGADYVSFSPVGQTPLGDGQSVPMDLFSWWSEVIEVPVVAEGNLDQDLMASLSKITDFVALGSELWSHDDPATHVRTLIGYL